MAENENGQEKTEQPSAKRREEAQEKGQVAKSQELNSVAVIAGTLIVFKYMASHFGNTIKGYMGYIYSESGVFVLNKTSFMTILAMSLKTVALVLGPVLLTVLTFGVVSNVGQTGLVWADKAMKPDFSKINIFKGLKRLISTRSLVELLKGVLKITIIAFIGYSVLSKLYGTYLVMPHRTVAEIAGFLGDAIYELTFKVLLALLVMAIADFAYQRYEHEKSLKMTKDEVKDEAKQAEGDPKVKSRIKSIMRQRIMERMMSKVPEATVVVTNPTHYAVALKYEPGSKSDAPMVVAKGKNLIAQKIKEIAAEHDVPVIENKPLARSLYAMVEVDQEIPEMLYQAVAEVLSQVFQANREKFNQIQGAING
ncbi:MAG: flagellar biosynthesis protein FlhB [Calditrichaeota bacterium]|nr:MAG: flagellar biosynthesis protein FlhB [Calditrichota bacterium]